MKQIQPGIYKKNNKLYTETRDTEKVYGENIIKDEDTVYRAWNPNRSKAAAAVLNNLKLGINKDDTVLYLGAASGTTVSHFSDILENGLILAVEYSETVIRDLVKLAERRSNIAPQLADARKPEEYEKYIDKAKVVFQDISQQDQAEIFLKNVEKYLAEDGVGLLSVKARSISTADSKQQIFEEVRQKIEEKMEIVNETELAPYEKEHLMIKAEKK